jgi:hypothetical protein
LRPTFLKVIVMIGAEARAKRGGGRRAPRGWSEAEIGGSFRRA